MIPLNVLDLCPILEGGDAGGAFAHAAALARTAEDLGYRRYWLAEHHAMPGIASAATAVVIAHVAAATRTIRVGAGGIMLPNHAPLVVAEQFGTLAALFPGRIDLGLGRAPGTDPLTARALRRTLDSDPDAFPQDVIELMSYFRPAEPGQRVRAVPGAGLDVPVWILGSSLFGAQLAAALGLPFAFASHFAPGHLIQALDIYRARFRPSERWQKPHAMAGIGIYAADTEEEARLLFTSQQQAFVNLRRGTPGPLPPPSLAAVEAFSPLERAMIGEALACSFVGTREAVAASLDRFVSRTGVDELMVTCAAFDQEARRRSYALAMEAAQRLRAA